ncbi:MAG: tyrosine protein kinase [Leeuwenhoekiella sp.]|jgi:capsular exopolysaccharide synthesis family protein|uniref:GumC family protein n=1 Tax=Leeuwenhoekiella blandensis TaxID=360293 RepID=UPI000C38E16C|nr:polysaccharide biosynthesis tyrosine autokinase [Leeuwenhoekiella blandensis]MBQ52045.1 tyrosine protein kinase [Leeuwenhoekiella sp.]|tara:strand:+ start:12643 stop:15045 length:2403 start_codon:yes stop_codon:yes gene_type:complete
MSDNQSLNNLEEQEINLREELDKYLRYWPWFILGVLASIILAFVYLKLTVPVYNTVASVIIKDDEGSAGGIGSELAAFEDLGLLGGMSTSSIENEIGLFKSRRMMVNTVSALKLNISYFDTEGLKADELYLNTPFSVEVISLDKRGLLEAQENEENEFFIKPDSGKNLSVEIAATGEKRSTVPGQLLSLPWGSFIIKDNRAALADLEEVKTNVLVRVATIEDVADYFKKEVKVELTDDNATLLQFGLESTVPQKARDILDQLIFEYNKEAIQDKNEVALSTARFIDERLAIINEELDTVEVGIEEFKEDNSLTDIEAEGKLILENASDYRQKEQELTTQRAIAQSLLNYLIDDDFGDQPLPANVGLEGESVNAQIGRYNDLILERNRIRAGATELNPIVSRLNAQIEQLKETILTGMRRQVANLNIAISDLNQQNRLIGDEIAAVPAKERKFRDISRQQNIKEALYIFLLQRREENSLSLAATAPKAKIVDSAYTSKEAVFPNPKIILAAALLLGLGIPFVIIYIRRLLNNKIERREDVEKITKTIPIVGELPRIAKGDSDLIEENDRSVLAESFRIMTTNLQYLLVNAKNEGKGYCIYTTSTVKGEGKTFTSINLAMTLANTGKKVILIGADLRNPQLQRYDTESKSAIGVSDYLVNEDHRLESLIHDSKFHPNLKLFLSGSIPPNPSELLRQSKFGRMIHELREQYDYVIVDTAPSMLVADTFLISKYADLILYVTRAGYTEKKLLNFAVDVQNDGKLHDISFVINDVKTANFGYGNKYGYAYGQSKPSLWERFKKSF